MRMCYCDSGRKYPIEITLHSCLTFKAPIGIAPVGVLTWRKNYENSKRNLMPHLRGLFIYRYKSHNNVLDD